MKRGTVVHDENLRYADDAKKRAVRLRLAKTPDNSTVELLSALAKCTTPAEMAATADGACVGESDVLEAAFLMGPECLTSLLVNALHGAKNVDDIADAAELSALRHELLAALLPAD
jgi:hypothetical protein